MSRDHAAALAVLDRITPGPHEARFVPEGMPSDCVRYGTVSLSKGIEVCRAWEEHDARAIAALPELAALHRAASKFPGMWDAFKTARNGGNMEEAYYCLAKGKHAHWDELIAALAAVADALTKGEGK